VSDLDVAQQRVLQLEADNQELSRQLAAANQEAKN